MTIANASQFYVAREDDVDSGDQAERNLWRAVIRRAIDDAGRGGRDGPPHTWPDHSAPLEARFWLLSPGVEAGSLRRLCGSLGLDPDEVQALIRDALPPIKFSSERLARKWKRYQKAARK